MTSDVLTAVAALEPQLRQAAARADGERRLADDTVAALRDAGTFRVTRPARFGGEDASIRAHLDLSSAVPRSTAARAGARPCGTAATGSPACTRSRRRRTCGAPNRKP